MMPANICGSLVDFRSSGRKAGPGVGQIELEPDIVPGLYPVPGPHAVQIENIGVVIPDPDTETLEKAVLVEQEENPVIGMNSESDRIQIKVEEEQSGYALRNVGVQGSGQERVFAGGDCRINARVLLIIDGSRYERVEVGIKVRVQVSHQKRIFRIRDIRIQSGIEIGIQAFAHKRILGSSYSRIAA